MLAALDSLPLAFDPLGPAAGWLSLSAYVALYPATWVWLLSPVGVLARSWSRRALWAIYGAALWVALEMLVVRLFTGFPWNPLGASQYQMVPLIQIASVTGIYGVSFLIVWVSLSLLSAGLMIVLRPTTRSAWVSEIILPPWSSPSSSTSASGNWPGIPPPIAP